ncbi:hypothetical protein FHR32_005108 [Streptosporangium album]|uniref:Uncharacterized protein n=1 Tax=Streptosporangium album TaxID=47479 RepID=A0A7W7RYS3_9ACTN|nr:hypothetical protein [Streptosporangium album]MBB4940731.1 hypothetical protein [Streptosporangium album]
MTNPDGVLAAIDACLSDYSVSPDAMRCAPDVDAEPTRPRPSNGTGILWDGTRVSWDGTGEILSWPLATPHPAEWQYTTVGTDPAVVEVRRNGQPWGAYLYQPESALEGTTLPPE